MIETIHWHTLHPRFLSADSNVLDLGANHGEFSRAIIDRFGCRCVAVEPSPEVFARIPEMPRLSKIQAAVAGKSGSARFHVAQDSVASSLLRKADSNLGAVNVEVYSLPDLLDKLSWSGIDLLKIDIEGSEIDMLEQCPDQILCRISQIAAEFHDFCGITPENVVHATLARLHRLGFFSVRMSRVGHQDTWLVNRRRLNISLAELQWIRLAVRNWNGLKRVAGRALRRQPSLPVPQPPFLLR